MGTMCIYQDPPSLYVKNKKGVHTPMRKQTKKQKEIKQRSLLAMEDLIATLKVMEEDKMNKMKKKKKKGKC